jgi:hypothetical protein
MYVYIKADCQLFGRDEFITQYIIQIEPEEIQNTFASDRSKCMRNVHAVAILLPVSTAGTCGWIGAGWMLMDVL